MGRPPTEEHLRRVGAHYGSHELCYRCDSFEKNSDGTCELCGRTDRMASCVQEWCPYCKGTRNEAHYREKCSLGGEPRHRAAIFTTPDALVFGAGAVRTYAIICGSYVKIGRSRDPQRRLTQLQTGAPLPARMLSSIIGDRESEIHRHLEVRGVRRTNGEWFEYDEDAKRVLSAYGLDGEARR
jgi:hypothetical protein